MLKNRGKYLLNDKQVSSEDDTHSELTIYRNTVQKRRDGSSSSKDDINALIEGNMSSDDQFDSFDSTEKELHR